jgi:hypothetical protein
MPRSSDSSRVRESQADIAAELEEAIRSDARERARIRDETRDQAERVRDAARARSPINTGAYAAAWKVDNAIRNVDGMPAFRVSNKDFKARWIEYGTGEPYPTEEFAVARKTAAEFGGTVDG